MCPVQSVTYLSGRSKIKYLTCILVKIVTAFSEGGDGYNHMGQRRPLSIMIVAALMIIFGASEVATGFSHTFIGLHTAQGEASTFLGAGIGALYAAAGFLVLTMGRRAARVAIAFLIVVIVGRILMITTGLYPVNNVRQAAAIAMGTTIVVVFALFIGRKSAAFR